MRVEVEGHNERIFASFGIGGQKKMEYESFEKSEFRRKRKYGIRVYSTRVSCVYVKNC